MVSLPLLIGAIPVASANSASGGRAIAGRSIPHDPTLRWSARNSAIRCEFDIHTRGDGANSTRDRRFVWEPARWSTIDVYLPLTPAQNHPAPERMTITVFGTHEPVHPSFDNVTRNLLDPGPGRHPNLLYGIMPVQLMTAVAKAAPNGGVIDIRWGDGPSQHLFFDLVDPTARATLDQFGDCLIAHAKDGHSDGR